MAETSTNLGRVSLVPCGEYDPTAQYQRLDIVSYNGSSYLALRNLQGVTPADGADYMLIARAGEDGAPGANGADGATGNGISSIERTSGTGAAGTVDTYTITMTDGSAYPFQVYNGADGSCAGDMTKSVYDPQGKSTDVFAYVDNGLVLKQPLLTGQPGQVVGFGADGAAVAQDASDLADAVTVPGGGVMELGPELGEGPYTFEFEEDGEAAVSAAQVSYDGTQSGLQAETVQGAVDALSARTARVSNPNLLDNWYFVDPINQKGQAEYTEAGYTIDRWSSNADSLRVENGGIVVENGDSENAGIRQPIDAKRLIPGRTYTISVLVAELDGTAKLTFWGKNYVDIEAGITSYTFIHTGEEAETTAYPVVHLHGSIKPIAAKLELGSVQTLAHKEGDAWLLNDPPPDKALELLKCQRYFMRYFAKDFDLRFGYAVPYASTHATVQVSLPCTMRTMPTVSLPVTSYIADPYSEYHIIGLSVAAYDQNYIVLDALVDGAMTIGRPSLLRLPPNAYLNIDANL